MSTKVTDLVCYLLFRLLLPVTLLAATVVRFNGLSFLYLIFLLISVLLSSPSPENIKGLTGLYLKLLIVVGSLGSLAQVIFHIVLAALATNTEPYGYAFPNCSTNEKIARQFGVERLDDVPVHHVVRLVAPDAVVLIVAILVFVVCYKLLSSAKPEGSQQSLPTTVPKIRRRRRFADVVVFIGEFLVVLFLAASGIIVPSVISAIYFLSFLCTATWWSFYKRLGRGFAFFRTFLLVWNILHILILYLYQFQFFQEVLPPDDFVPRLLGLTGIIKTDCDKPWSVEFHDVSKWPYFINPAILFILYIVLAVETRHWRHRQDVSLSDGTGNSHTEKSKKRRQRKPLERQVLPSDSKSQAENLVEEGDGQSYNTFEDTGTPTMYESDPEDAVDGTDETEPKKKLVKRKDEKRSAIVSIIVYVMKQSYVLSLIAMMAWSITFHSWLTFVLLFVACIIWMIPKSRKACLTLSPVILFYGEVLLIIQFIYGLDLTEEELPSKAGDVKLDEIGLKRFAYPCLQLGLQILFTSTFWLTMRQFMRERRLPPDMSTSGYAMEPVHRDSVSPSIRTLLSFPSYLDTIDGYDSNTMKGIGGFVWTLMAKYWIFVCAGMMLLISLQDVVIYRIIYLIFVLYFFLSFQLWYSLWRITMKIYWWCVIIYSMAVLIMLYTYQFSDFPSYWKNGTGLAEETIHDIGLELFDTAGLFVKLLTPTSFLILIIIQVHYFHRPFLVLSDLDRYKKEENSSPDTPLGLHSTDTEGNTTDTIDGKIMKKVKGWRKKFRHYFVIVWNKCSDVWGWLSIMLWRIAEIHMFKVVAFTVVMVSVSEVSAVNAVYVILLCILIPIPGARILFSHLAQFWTGLVMLSKMIYQLRLVEKDYWISNCTAANGTTYPANNPFARPIDNANWVGFDKTTDLSYYLRRYVAILLIIAFERIVIYHQRQHFNASGFPKPQKGIIFPETKRQDADKNIKNCLKYFANYFFYKYGLEICYIMSAITISVRVDVYSLIYAIFLGILLLLSRRGNARIWPLYTIILAVLLPVQFVLRLGFPLGLCIEYPWEGNSYVDRNFEKWLFLPDYEYPQNAFKLVADFFQLLFVCLQWQVFRKETSNNMENYGGGDNQDILPEVEGNTPIPVEDFTSSFDSYLDVLKFAIFVYLFWVTLFIVFLTGTARINIFSMGYVVAVFCFMWYGQEFILLPLRKIRRRWCMLIGYTYFVLLLKAALQLLGCVYIDLLYENQCWLIQLLGLTCLNPSNRYQPGQGVLTCEVEKDNTGLMWDVICFTFLLLQLRIYKSQYFRHVVASAEAQSRLASRGAELINRILIKDVLKQKEDEKIVLHNIKKKMEVLKKKQAHKKSDFIEPDEHFQAIRSGDYFLFDEDSDKEEGPDTITLGRDDEDNEGTADPLKIITTALDSGTKAAVDKADDMDEKKSLDEIDIQGDSKGATCDEESEEEKDSASDKDSIFNKVKNILKLIMRVLESFADWLIENCNRISRNYRLVARKLEKEMKTEKEKIQAEKQSLVLAEKKIEIDSFDAEDGGIEDDGHATGDTVDLLEVKVQPGKRMQSLPSEISLAEPKEDKTKFESSKPKIYLLLEACFYVIISRSELVCYFLMVLDQILNASLLSLPLPLMVFLWGMLSVPRPSKTFWITVITYTEAVVVLKYLFQFNFFPWNDNTNIETSPFWPPRILGIEKQKNYAVPELVLLLALFIHRSILKRYGLWKDADDITADYKEAEEIYLSRPSSPVTAPEDDADVTRSIEEGEASTSKQLSSTEESGQSGVEDEPKKKKKIKSKLISYTQPFQDFYKQLTNPIYNATTDVYAPMFACDFIGFLIVVFGYWAFGPAESGSGDVSSYISENKIPVLFLVMLVTLFVFIIIDRALYLRKNVLGKFVFQIFLVIFIHIYMFFILPAVTGRKFSENVPAQLLYFIKCVYFGLSAYQIRSGYPTRILGNFLTKKYNYLNLFLFKGFLAIPFLLELRVLMDWIWTDSTLAIGSWLTMEDIYANIYILKCWREAERKYPTPRGYKKSALIKYGLGGVLLVAIIFIIWFPLVVFSFANTVFIVNPPIECTITIAVGGFQPLFKMTAQQQYIKPISTLQYNTLKNHYSKNPAALGFLDGFEPKDITQITLDGRSSSIWGISPPSQKALVESLSSSSEQDQLEFYISFSRLPSSGEAGESLSNQFLLKLDPAIQQRMADMVNGTGDVKNVTIFGFFPRFIHLGNKGRAEPELVLRKGYSNISLSLKSEGTRPGIIEQWWEAEEVLCGDIYSPGTCNGVQKLNTNSDLTIVTFNDRVAPQGFSIITGYGIIGLYITFILLIGRILRLSTTGLVEKIQYLELPYVDNILKTCLDLYLVREMREFRLEEDLFAKVLFVYRSSETRINWTRLPQDKIITDAKKND